MALLNKIRLQTDLPNNDPPGRPPAWKKILAGLLLIGLLLLVFFVPHPTIFYYSTVITMSLILAAVLLFTPAYFSTLAELQPGKTSFDDRFFTLLRHIKHNRANLFTVMLVMGGIFAWAALGVPWVVEQIIGPYVCPPGYNEMTFKNSVTRIPVAGYVIAYSFEGYCSGSLGIFRGIRLLHFFIGLIGAYFVLCFLCLLAVLLVRLIQPPIMIAAKTVGAWGRMVLVFVLSLGLWSGLLAVPSHAPAIPQTVSRLFNLTNYYSTHLHARARYGGDIDKLVMALEAYPYNVNREDNHTETPLALALRHNNLVETDMLRRYGGKINTRWQSITDKRKRDSDYTGLTFQILKEINCDLCQQEVAERETLRRNNQDRNK